MVTEDNAEPYMTMVQGLLTLDAFKTSLAQSATAGTPPSARMAPAYPMVSSLFPFYFRICGLAVESCAIFDGCCAACLCCV